MGFVSCPACAKRRNNTTCVVIIDLSPSENGFCWLRVSSGEYDRPKGKRSADVSFLNFIHNGRCSGSEKEKY